MGMARRNEESSIRTVDTALDHGVTMFNVGEFYNGGESEIVLGNALRQHHPAFRMGNADLVRKHLEFLDAPKGVVAYRLKGYAGRDDWRDIIVILNANKTATEVTIPEGTYTIVCAEGCINESGLGTLTGPQAKASPQSALILYR
jgi:hypothetical protein